MTHRTLSHSLRESLRKVANYYEQSSKMNTKNFAGAENNDDDDEYQSAKESLTMSNMNVSKYQFLSQRGQLGFWSTMFTFIKVNVVAGFLFLPNGFKSGGWLFSSIAILVITLIVVYGNISLADCSEPATSYSFSRIGFKAAGKVGFYCVEIGICLSQVFFNYNKI